MSTIVALLCSGTIAGAIPCGIGYGVIAGVATIGAGLLSYCDRYSRGIYLKYHWIGGWWSCGTR